MIFRYAVAERAVDAPAFVPEGVEVGDLLIVATTTCEIGVAASVNASGRVESVRYAWQGEGGPAQRVELIRGLRQIVAVPSGRVDVAAVFQADRARACPATGMAANPYDTVSEACDALRPYLRNAEEA